MRLIAKLLSFAGLGLTIIPSILVFSGGMSWRMHTQLMFAGMALWFICAPVMMRKKTSSEA